MVTRDGTVSVRAGGCADRTEEGRRALVLLVDDYQDCREMYGAGLTLAGFRVVTARDGFEALQLARNTRPDVILMDLGLPGIDGCETARLLKQDPRTSTVPIVALTAQPLPRDEAAFLGYGFEDVIFKPCLPDALADYVSRVLVRRDRHPVVA
ncbi:MAG: response regulator [Acidobacteria bacterium]|nr:MAG: response regulator [Acidobacteriota bacterium]